MTNADTAILDLPRSTRRRLILGIGNPGDEYRHHRHNAGFQCLDAFARKHEIKFDEGHKMARLAEGEVEGVRVVLAKPKTYVNRSGEAAAALLQRYQLKPEDLIVVFDELDLPMGRVRVRERGSAGGHNGMKNIIDRIGSQDFTRVRVGIGRPPVWDADWRNKDKDESVIKWVLSNFKPDEEEVMAVVRERVGAALLTILTQGTERAMNYFNNDKNFA